MAVLLKVTMRRVTTAGISCKSTRPIVILSDQVSRETMDKLESALSEAREIYSEQAFVKSQSTIITEVCDTVLAPGKWHFTVLRGEIQF